MTAAAFSPDGRQAISASRDKTVKLWDLALGTVVRTFGPLPDELTQGVLDFDV